MTWRRLGVLIRGLPRESVTSREVDPRAAWGDTEYLLALIFDVLRWANWQRQGDSKARKPEPIPRPGPRSAGLSDAEKVARLLAQRQRNERILEAVIVDGS